MLSLLHYVAYVMSPGSIYGQLPRSGWMYFRRITLVRGRVLTCSGDMGGNSSFLGQGFCDDYGGLSDLSSNVSTAVSSWEISFGWLIWMDVVDANLFFVAPHCVYIWSFQ